MNLFKRKEQKSETGQCLLSSMKTDTIVTAVQLAGIDVSKDNIINMIEVIKLLESSNGKINFTDLVHLGNRINSTKNEKSSNY